MYCFFAAMLGDKSAPNGKQRGEGRFITTGCKLPSRLDFAIADYVTVGPE
jgi:hypothetical protein